MTEDFLWDHEWITETKVTMEENLILEVLHYDIEVPCNLQWAWLWFSAPTNLNSKFVNNGTKIVKFRDSQQRNRADVQHRLRWCAHSEGVFLAGGDNSVELRA